MENNRIHPMDKVQVDIENEQGHPVLTYETKGFRNIESAILAAYDMLAGKTGDKPGESKPVNQKASESLEAEPSFHHYYRNPEAGANRMEDYVYTVTDLTTGTTARYRINAGGHVRILPEERR